MKLGSLVGGSATVIGPEATLADAAEALVADGVGSLGVVSDRTLVGIFTERDLVRAIAEGVDPEGATVTDWMADTPDTFSPDVDIDDAARWLLEVGYRHMPVMAEGELLGIVSIRDILWAIVGNVEGE